MREAARDEAVDDEPEPRWLRESPPLIRDAGAALGTRLQDADAYYRAFEDVFRGTPADIEERQRHYLSYLPEDTALPIVDIGCGRGEFLDLLAASGRRGIGVEPRPALAAEVSGRGHEVVTADGITALASMPSGHLGGVTAFQVIEHVDATYLQSLLFECARVLVPGGVLIVETVNPWSPRALGNFWIDETHLQPRHPEAVRFALEWFGFQDIRQTFSSPVEAEFRIAEHPECNYLDYATIGYKASVDSAE